VCPSRACPRTRLPVEPRARRNRVTPEGRHAHLHWLQAADQRIALCPSVGGSVAAWQWLRGDEVVDLMRPLRVDGSRAETLKQKQTHSRPQTPPQRGMPAQPPSVLDMACFPLVPWSNRIGGGGFAHEGRFYALQANTDTDPYPIHGEGWQRAWAWQPTGPASARMSLLSRERRSVHRYRAVQTLALQSGQLQHALMVQNLGDSPLPFGLGLHPWFETTPQCAVTASVRGVWHSGSDRLPMRWSAAYPNGWDLNQGVRPARAVIDNAYMGWSGVATLRWPERDVALHLEAGWWVSHQFMQPQPQPLSVVLYAPEKADVFCFEPVTHPINAPHLPGRPGWVALAPGDSMTLNLRWSFAPCDAGS
jgi:aldose 1-epimerase